MKKILAVLMALVLVFSLGACKEKEETAKVKIGMLPNAAALSETQAMYAHSSEVHNDNTGNVMQTDSAEFVKYDNLSSMLLDLKAEKIDLLSINAKTAAYIVEHNEDLAMQQIPTQHILFSMATLETDTELYDLLNNAIKELKAEGVIDTLAETYLANPQQVVELPVVEGAKTYKVAVTGDMPPIDFVSADGIPTGFNVALLAEISKKAGINIELVVVDAGARASALASGKVDSFFWMISGQCAEHPEFQTVELIEGVKKTEEYITFDVAYVYRKK